jgi:hypothetical protein
MARVVNRQLGHVGNLGDIIKHAALLELATMLARGGPTHGVSFVETHTFQLHAPLPEPDRWTKQIASHRSKHAAYMRYEEAERHSLSRTGRYRCSSGLVLDALGNRLSRAVLAESNAASRAEIASQLRAENRGNVALVDDASAIDRDSFISAGGALLVHVDPFALTETAWSSFEGPLSSIIARSADAVMVVYRYSRGARTDWPRTNMSLVAETRGGPHEVCAYASTEIADEVRGVCAALGWGVTDSD